LFVEKSILRFDNQIKVLGIVVVKTNSGFSQNENKNVDGLCYDYGTIFKDEK